MMSAGKTQLESGKGGRGHSRQWWVAVRRRYYGCQIKQGKHAYDNRILLDLGRH